MLGDAEGSVEDGAARRRVQAHHGRAVRDRGVGETFGHQHRPRHESRYRTAAQPLGSVAPVRNEQRKLHSWKVARIFLYRSDSWFDDIEPDLELVEKAEQGVERGRVRGCLELAGALGGCPRAEKDCSEGLLWSAPRRAPEWDIPWSPRFAGGRG